MASRGPGEARMRVITLNVCLPPPFVRNHDLPSLVTLPVA